MSVIELRPAQVEEVCRVLSTSAGFFFTRQQLLFELMRRGVIADPGRDPTSATAAFEAALGEYERAHGELPQLIRPERLVDLPPPAELPPDVLDYSVRRVLVFDRLDTCLFFVCNGFHRRIEVGLVVWPDPGEPADGAAATTALPDADTDEPEGEEPDAGAAAAPALPTDPAAPGFPAHVCARLRQQMESRLTTEFFLVGDCSAESRAWRQRMHAMLRRPQVRVRDASLTFPWAFRLRLPVRATGRAPQRPESIPENHEWRGLLMVGSYALLQEMRPIRLLRWVYRRVARGAEDVGFG
ncbi:MAG: hypothetical protein K1X88_25325 [Nannocystaceae bacterium]|nr:hypothetical protein [Nannocystaceae bacterium]